MELFAIVGSIPAAFVASAVYFPLLRAGVRKVPIERGLARGSAVILMGLVIEWMLLASVGPVRLRAVCGPIFYPIHLVLFLCSVPALATILTLKTLRTRLDSWLVVAFACGVLAMPVTLTQYAVAEALYGIDGQGGPYGHD